MNHLQRQQEHISNNTKNNNNNGDDANNGKNYHVTTTTITITTSTTNNERTNNTYTGTTNVLQYEWQKAIITMSTSNSDKENKIKRRLKGKGQHGQQHNKKTQRKDFRKWLHTTWTRFIM